MTRGGGLARVAPAAAVLVFVTAAFAEPPGQPDGMHAVSGTYRNVEYGFTVAVPRNARAYVSNGPDHGVLLVLGEGRTITVSAVDIDEFVNGTICHRKLRDRPRNQVVDQRSIAGEPACAVISDTRYDYFELRQQVRDDHGKRVLYAMQLQTVPRSLAADLQEFDAVADGFTRMPIGR